MHSSLNPSYLLSVYPVLHVLHVPKAVQTLHCCVSHAVKQIHKVTFDVIA